VILGITTAPRPDGVQYLENTLISAKKAGFHRVILCCDDIMPPLEQFGDECFPSGGIQVFVNPKRLGNYGNFKELAEKVLHFSDDNEPIVTAEDDIEFCSDAHKQILLDMAFTPIDDFGFFAAYSSSCHQNHLLPNSVAPLKTTSLWGACCLVWTKESLQALVNHKTFKEWRGLDDNRYSIGDPRIKHVDTCISKVMDKLDRKMYFCRPSLVRHIGTISSLRKKAWTPDRNCNEFEESKT